MPTDIKSENGRGRHFRRIYDRDAIPRSVHDASGLGARTLASVVIEAPADRV